VPLRDCSTASHRIAGCQYHIAPCLLVAVGDVGDNCQLTALDSAAFHCMTLPCHPASDQRTCSYMNPCKICRISCSKTGSAPQVRLSVVLHLLVCMQSNANTIDFKIAHHLHGLCAGWRFRCQEAPLRCCWAHAMPTACTPTCSGCSSSWQDPNHQRWWSWSTHATQQVRSAVKGCRVQ
jgi:hypothetical protein